MEPKTNRPQSDQAPQTPDFLSRRARILVTMLGADFAKSSAHPFFDRLIDLASKDAPGERISTQDPQLSRSLTALVKGLQTAGAGDKSHEDPQRESVMPREPGNTKPETGPDDRATPSIDQHPVIIARSVLGLTPPDRAKVLRALPGRTSRQVLRILERL